MPESVLIKPFPQRCQLSRTASTTLGCIDQLSGDTPSSTASTILGCIDQFFEYMSSHLTWLLVGTPDMQPVPCLQLSEAAAVQQCPTAPAAHP